MSSRNKSAVFVSILCLLTLSCLPAMTNQQLCGSGSLTASSGTVRSPNYPSNYSHNMNCTWHIEVAPDKLVELKVTDFYLENHRVCGLDYVEFSATREHEYGRLTRDDKYRYCGDVPQHTVVSRTNSLTITFRSDGSVVRKGFSFDYSSIDPGRPEFGNASARLTVLSSTMMSLNWEAPQCPYICNNITAYQYRCREGASPFSIWQNKSSVDRTALIGPYQPYKPIMCEIMAINSVGSDTISVGPEYTLCSRPSHIAVNIAKESYNVGRSERWRWTFTLEASVRANCNILATMLVGINGSLLLPEFNPIAQEVNFTGNTTSITFENLPAASTIDITVIVSNNQGYRSDPFVQTDITGELAPEYPPRDLGFVIINSTCTQISWKAPYQPNGNITSYQGSCSYNSVTVSISTNGEWYYETCAMRPIPKLLNCSLQARNSAGLSPFSYIWNSAAREDRHTAIATLISAAPNLLLSLTVLVVVPVLAALIVVVVKYRQNIASHGGTVRAVSNPINGDLQLDHVVTHNRKLNHAQHRPKLAERNRHEDLELKPENAIYLAPTQHTEDNIYQNQTPNAGLYENFEVAH